jgi:RNA polymerase sigma-70 factor (ECF subfamily)
MKNYSDEQLIDIYQHTQGGRRQQAFDQLYVRYAEPMRQFFFFALYHDNEKAKDFVHDLFLKLMEAPHKFDKEQRFKPWFYQVAHNMCKNEYRKKEVEDRYTLHVLETGTEVQELDETEQKLNESICQLSEDKRTLIVLRYKQELSIKEIADIFGCPEGTVKSRLFYAMKDLSKLYKNIEL